jgi:hypothetical protein
MLATSIQIRDRAKARNPIGVQKTTNSGTPTQPSHLGSRSLRRAVNDEARTSVALPTPNGMNRPAVDRVERLGATAPC